MAWLQTGAKPLPQPMMTKLSEAILHKSHRTTPPPPTDDKSTLVLVMAWCLKAPSHYLSHCWPRSMLPYVITRPQWVKTSHTNTPMHTLNISYQYTNAHTHTHQKTHIFLKVRTNLGRFKTTKTTTKIQSKLWVYFIMVYIYMFQLSPGCFTFHCWVLPP